MGVPRFWANWRKRSRSRSVSLMVSPSRLSSPRPIWNTNVPMRISSETGCEGALSAPQDITQPQQKFTRLEGFWYVVFDPDLEALDALLGLGACCQHADRDVAIMRFYLARELEAADAGHHDVEQHDIEREPPHGWRAPSRRPAPSSRESPANRDSAREDRESAMVVVDDEHVRCIVGERFDTLNRPRSHGPTLVFVAIRRLFWSSSDERFDLRPVCLRYHLKTEPPRGGLRLDAGLLECRLDPLNLKCRKFVGEPRSLGRNVKKAFARGPRRRPSG